MDRAKIVNSIIFILFLLLGLGLVNLEVVHGTSYRDLSNKNCIRLLPQAGGRGKILDRNGNIIVDNKLSYDVMVLPYGLSSIDALLVKVSGILGISQRNLKSNYKKGYVSASIPVTIAKNISISKAISLEELKLDLPGVVIQPNPTRRYPHAGLASNVIGYVGEIDRWRLTKLSDYGYNTKDIVGFGGVEEKYDYYLRQEEGGTSFEVDHRGRFIRTLGFKQPSFGRDIELTLDLRIQQIAEEFIKDRKGAVVVMDPYTGEIIAMASAPGFDPSVFVDRTDSVAGLFNSADSPMINRAYSGAYPPGSIFKLIVATAGLESKKLKLNTTINCQGKTLVGKKEFACWETHGNQSLISAIAHSCNVFFYRAGLVLGPQLIHDYAVKFGLSRPVSFDLPYETGGFIPSPLWRRVNKFKSWFDGDTANLSIGQGDVLVTPLQMARVIAVFANRGFLVTPYITKTVAGNDAASHKRKAVSLSLKEATIEHIREGLREVVSAPGGTGNVLSSLSVSVAGKTGTAQAPPGQPHAWFVGFFPFKNPKYVICVFLERGGPGYVSCVVAKQIIEKMVSEGLI